MRTRSTDTEVAQSRELWVDSASAWLARLPKDVNRTLLLDPVMLSLVGPPGDALDVGCGEGRFVRMLSDHGFRCIGIDPTLELLAAGKSPVAGTADIPVGKTLESVTSNREELAGSAGILPADLGIKTKLTIQSPLAGTADIPVGKTLEVATPNREELAGSAAVPPADLVVSTKPELARADGVALPFRSESFDLTISYLTLLDIPDFRAAISEMTRVTRTGGRILVANCTAMVTPQPEPWVRDENGNRLHVQVDRYMEERGVRVAWSGIDILNFHRPLGAYFSAFLSHGLRLEHFSEPVPTNEALEACPGLEDHFRVPNFYVMLWRKP